MDEQKQTYRVSMSLGYSTIVEAATPQQAIGVALDKPDVTVGGVIHPNSEWGSGVWDNATLDVEEVTP